MNVRIGLALAAFGLAALTACAQAPVDHSAHQAAGVRPPAGAATGDAMARMDAHMKAVREMREKMARAGTPEERQALMEEHRKLMREGMAMLEGMHGMGMSMGAGPGPGPGSAPAPGGGMGAGMKGMGAHHKMMEKHMALMHSMMRMMMDRMEMPAPRP